MLNKHWECLNGNSFPTYEKAKAAADSLDKDNPEKFHDGRLQVKIRRYSESSPSPKGGAGFSVMVWHPDICTMFEMAYWHCCNEMKWEFGCRDFRWNPILHPKAGGRAFQ